MGLLIFGIGFGMKIKDRGGQLGKFWQFCFDSFCASGFSLGLVWKILRRLVIWIVAQFGAWHNLTSLAPVQATAHPITKCFVA